MFFYISAHRPNKKIVLRNFNTVVCCNLSLSGVTTYVHFNPALDSDWRLSVFTELGFQFSRVSQTEFSRSNRTECESYVRDSHDKE